MSEKGESELRRVARAPCRSLSNPAPLSTSRSFLRTPSYTTLLSLSSGASVRKVAPTTWVTAVLPTGTPLDDARSEGFMKNFAYISKNEYEMTAPVLTRVSEDGTVRVSFMLPAAVTSPADGSAQGVVVESLPSRTVAVKPARGASAQATSWDALASQARSLASEAQSAQLTLAATVPPEAPEEAKKDGGAAAAVGPGVWYAGYSSPMTLPADKYSEVWLPVEAGSAVPGAAP